MCSSDLFGKTQFVYAWKLVPTDKTPKGKREDKSLREKVKEIQKDLDDGIDPVGKKMTVCQLYAKQIRNHANVRHSTKQGRKQLMRILEEDTIGTCSIENVKMSDAKEWALRMKEKGLRHVTEDPGREHHEVGSYAREAVYVPETKLADDLLREIQVSHVHMVLAVDEYGGTAGLVTLEDLLEEVVGDRDRKSVV